MWFNRHKNMAMAMGIAVVAVVLFLVAILPIYQNASSLMAKIKTKSSELENMTNKVAILSQLDANVLKERVDVLDSALPPRKDVLLYLNAIDSLSRELGLTFGGISLTPGDLTEASGSAKAATKVAAKNGGLQTLETDIKMRGSQDSIYSFLRTLENVLPLMQIKDVKVSVSGNDQYGLAMKLAMLWAEPATLDVKGAVTLFGKEEDKYFNQLSQYRKFEPILNATETTGGKTDLFTPFATESVVIKPQQ